MNDNQRKQSPYIGRTEHNHQQIDYTDGELTFIHHVKYDARMHATQLDLVFIAMCRKGKLTFEMDGDEYTLTADDVFISPPNARFDRFDMSPDLECHLFCISKQLMLTMLYPNQAIWVRALYLNRHFQFHLNPATAKRRDLMVALLMCNIQEESELFSKEIIHSLMKAIVYKLCRTLNSSNQNALSQETNQRRLLFDKFISLLGNETVKKRPLGYFADKLCVSPRYLTMVCREVSHRTAYDWISEYVQNDVRYYLRNSNLTIKEISVKLGFCNLSFFGKYVREHFGMSPSEYRKTLTD